MRRAEESRAARVSIGRPIQLATPPAPRQFGWLCESAVINKKRPDGLYVTGGPEMLANAKRIAGFAIKSRLPSVGSREYVNAGGLMFYGADVADRYRRVA